MKPKKSPPVTPPTEFTCGECGTKHIGDHDCTKSSLDPVLSKELSSSLAQNVLSRLTSKLPSSAPVIPRGTPILSGKAQGPSNTSRE